MIEGVVLTPLKQIHDERGKVMHMLRDDSPAFERFGEIYFSSVHPGAVKAWHRHKRMTLNYAVVVGEIKFVLFDDRPGSATQGAFMELFISPENYMLVTVPPMIWNGFKSVGAGTAIVANCSTIAHSPDEIERLDPFGNAIDYRWDIRHA